MNAHSDFDAVAAGAEAMSAEQRCRDFAEKMEPNTLAGCISFDKRCAKIKDLPTRFAERQARQVILRELIAASPKVGRPKTSALNEDSQGQKSRNAYRRHFK